MDKYKRIILLILSIIIFNTIVALASYSISKNISRFNAYESSLSEQQVKLDKLSKDIIDIYNFTSHLNIQNSKELDEFLELTFNQVQNTKEFYDYLVLSLNTFSKGGELNINEENYILSKPTEKAAIIDKRINEIWQPLSALIDKMINEIHEENIEDISSNIKFTADYIRKYSEILGGYLGELKKLYQEQGDFYSTWLRYLQIFAIAFTVIFFGFLTYFGLKSLVSSDSKLEKAQKETSDIMKTVKEGLFLIDENLTISSQYSRTLEDILNYKNLSGQKLDEVLSEIISKDDFEITKDFIEQLFNDEVIEELIEELNPLDKVQIFLQQDSGIAESKYLSFNFSRVYDGDEIINILISVTDITRQIMLEERLEKERTQHDEQIEMLSLILNIPAITLQSFIRHVSGACNKINNILRSSTNLNKNQLVAKAEQIFREVHALKGESSALKLHRFVSLAEDMESKIATLKQKNELSGRDFLPLTIDLDYLLDLNNKVIEVQKKVAGDGVQIIEKSNLIPDKTKAEVQQLEDLVSEVAKRNQKEVKFLVRGWSSVQQLEEWQQDKLREVVIQLLRNAVVHGIENPKNRQAMQKNSTGRVLCDVLDYHDGFLNIRVVDDGGGIDFDALYTKALAEGKISHQESIEQAKPKLLRYLFSSGVSTAQLSNEDAGRGVGMDIVKTRLRELSAKIMLHSEKGKMTQFKMQIPIFIKG